MNKKIKTILSYIGVALLGALTGVGALVGVSSCSQQSEKTTTPLKSAARPQRKLITNDYEQIIGSDKIYYAVAKNVNNDGAGVFYNGTDKTSGIILDDTTFHPPSNYPELSLDLDITIYNGNEYLQKVFTIETTFAYTSMGNYDGTRLIAVVLQGTGIIYRSSDGVFNRQFSGFVFSNASFRYPNTPLKKHLEYFSKLFDIYELSDNYFEFSSQINYYAPYGQDIDSYYVNDSSMVNASSYSLKTILTGIPFLSGGQVFDTIRLRYQNAIATTYLDKNGNRQTWSVNGFASYSFTEYVNTATNLVIVVNSRIYQPWYDGASSGFNQTLSSKWVSKNYQTIRFFGDINDYQATTLSTLNNCSFSGGYIVNNNDIGLGNAFSLLGLAFNSVAGLLSIAVLPGITLGLLLFLPLIAGIIVAIIWVVKR